MSRPLTRAVSVLQFFIIAGIFSRAVFFPGVARAQFSTGTLTVNSVSGQFVVTDGAGTSPLLHSAEFATNANYVRLEPALLAVSAERFKRILWQELGLPPDSPWSGRIYLALRPAQSPDDAAGITVGPFLKTWSCHVELPDLVTQARYGRSLAAALLLEYASRTQQGPARVPEIPAWLADGLAQLAFANDGEKIILSMPSRMVNGLAQSRMDKKERGVDGSAAARRILQNSPALTFDEFCWPDDGQINDRDGGVYLASVETFTRELLGLKDGPQKMRNFLAALPGCYNWQTAFFQAFQEDFKRPLDVEKWWSLRVVRFASRDPGPHWTSAYSRDYLASLLSVPVEYRNSSNSLPVHTEISLQSAVRNFSYAQRETLLQTRLRDLELAQFRLAQPFAGLAGGYAAALADFMGERQVKPVVSNKQTNLPRMASVSATVQKLNLLDAQRRMAESSLQPVQMPGVSRSEAQ